jgi:hypothetical protein
MSEQPATYTTCCSACASCLHNVGDHCTCEESGYYRYWMPNPETCEQRLPAWGGLSEPEEERC